MKLQMGARRAVLATIMLTTVLAAKNVRAADSVNAKTSTVSENANIYEDENNAKVAQALNAAIVKDPNDAMAYIKRGVFRRDVNYNFLTHDEAGAQKDFDQAIALDPKNAQAYNERAKTVSSAISFGVTPENIADIKKRRSDYDQAVTLAIAKNDRYNFTLDRVRFILQTLDDDSSWAETYKGNKLVGGAVFSFSERADWTKQRDDDVTQLLVLDPKAIEPRMMRADWLQKDPKTVPDAIAEVNRVLDIEPKNVQALGTLETLYRSQGDWKNALLSVNRFIAVQPTSAVAFYERAQIQGNLGALDKALTDVDTAQKMPQTGKPNTNFPAQLGLLRAQILTLQKDYAKTVSACTSALATTKDTSLQAQLMSARSDAYFALGKNAEGLDDVKQISVLTPRNAVVWSALASHQVDAGQLTDAIKSLQTLLKLTPDDFSSRANLALVFAVTDDAENSKIEYSKSLSHLPKTEIEEDLATVQGVLKQKPDSAALKQAAQMLQTALSSAH